MRSRNGTESRAHPHIEGMAGGTSVTWRQQVPLNLRAVSSIVGTVVLTITSEVDLAWFCGDGSDGCGLVEGARDLIMKRER